MPGERPLTEYKPTLDADGTMRCFVASDAQPHETFELRWSCPSAATAAWMTVDGEAADAWCSSESYPFMGYGRDRRCVRDRAIELTAQRECDLDSTLQVRADPAHRQH